MTRPAPEPFGGHAASTAPRAGGTGGPAPGQGRPPPGGVRTLNRDFKHVTQQQPRGRPFTGWVGFASGLGLGLAVAAAVWLHYRDAPPAVPMPATSATPASARASDDEAVAAAPADTGGNVGASAAGDLPPAEDPNAELTFYDLLPRQEVEVPKPGTAPATRAPRQEVLLQAGAFRTMEQAEKRQAVLLSLGIESKIEHVVRSDETLYRVRLRSIGTLAEFEQVKTKLAEASIDFEGVGDVSVAPPP